MTYPKIETLFERGEDFKVDTSQMRLPEFDIPRRWLITEKVDGTNVRFFYSPSKDLGIDGEPLVTAPVLSIFGRTNKAQFTDEQKSYLEGLVTLEQMQNKFDGDSTVILYGELYGAGINSGGWYRKEGLGFRLFDVQVGDWWLDWHNVDDIAETFGLQTVPTVPNPVTGAHQWDIWSSWDGVLTAMFSEEPIDGLNRSQVARDEGGDGLRRPEGIVARTTPLLFTRKGERLMWKLKFKDFKGGKK